MPLYYTNTTLQQATGCVNQDQLHHVMVIQTIFSKTATLKEMLQLSMHYILCTSIHEGHRQLGNPHEILCTLHGQALFSTSCIHGLLWMLH